MADARKNDNTESTIGYNNKLKQAVAGMKLGVNNKVNSGTKKSARDRGTAFTSNAA